MRSQAHLLKYGFITVKGFQFLIFLETLLSMSTNPVNVAVLVTVRHLEVGVKVVGTRNKFLRNIKTLPCLIFK